MLGDIARQHVAAAREALPAQRRRQGHQWAVVALLLGTPEAPQRAVLAPAVAHVGQVVEDHRRRQPQQLALALEEALSEGLAVFEV